MESFSILFYMKTCKKKSEKTCILNDIYFDKNLNYDDKLEIYVEFILEPLPQSQIRHFVTICFC